jgi:fucose 4-O-acetylase-like acetyltransferase
MEHNPYTAPAVTEEVALLRQQAPRPVAVWLLLGSLLVCFLLMAWGALQSLWEARSSWRAFRVLPLAMLLALMASLVATVIGLYRRRPWSRWIGLAMLAGFLSYVILRTDTTHYENEAERAGGFLGRYVMWPLLVAWWAYAFGGSAKARRYFAGRPPDETGLTKPGQSPAQQEPRL